MEPKKNAKQNNFAFAAFECRFTAKLSFHFFFFLFQVGQTVLLGRILDNIDQDDTKRQGYLYCGILSLLALIHGLLHHIEFFMAARVGWNAREATFALIYERAVNMSLKSAFSAGQLINLASTDVERWPAKEKKKEIMIRKKKIKKNKEGGEKREKKEEKEEKGEKKKEEKRKEEKGKGESDFSVLSTIYPKHHVLLILQRLPSHFHSFFRFLAHSISH